jgi:hypothetical protein
MSTEGGIRRRRKTLQHTKFKLALETKIQKNVHNIVTRRNTGADLCARKLKTPFFQTEPRRSVTLDEIHETNYDYGIVGTTT